MALSHFKGFFRSILMSSLRHFGDLLIFNRFVILLSGKWWTFQCFMNRLRSFTHIRKSNGCNIEWGTPLVMVDIFELKPFIKTDCLRSVKYDPDDLFYILLLHDDLVSLMMLWSTVSKAFWRSRAYLNQKLSLLTDCTYKVEKCCWKPKCREYINFYLSRKSYILLYIFCYKFLILL